MFSCEVIHTSLQGNWVPIRHTVIYYARAAPQQELNVGTEEVNTLFSFSKTNLNGMVITFEREKIEIHIPFPWYLSEFVKCGGPWSIILVGSSV